MSLLGNIRVLNKSFANKRLYLDVSPRCGATQ